jgi:hypothetical protein
VLRANASHHEAHADSRATAEAMARELRLMAEWLGLPAVSAGPKGNLARHLRAAL